MVQTYGLTHINLAVRDLGRALRFYEQVFGLREYGRGDGLVHTQASGRHDIVTFAEDPATAGLSGGVAHFGFRLVDPNDIDRAITEVERAGGRLLRRGEFAPGLPTRTSPIRMATRLRCGLSELAPRAGPSRATLILNSEIEWHCFALTRLSFS